MKLSEMIFGLTADSSNANRLSSVRQKMNLRLPNNLGEMSVPSRPAPSLRIGVMWQCMSKEGPVDHLRRRLEQDAGSLARPWGTRHGPGSAISGRRATQ
jgi:hypothetical protein